MRKKERKNSQTLNDAQRKLVVDNLDYARRLSAKYAGIAISKGIDPQDIEQEASLGLCEAAMKYKEGSEAEFTSFAYNFCKHRIMVMLSPSEYTTEDDDVEAYDEHIVDDDEEQKALKERIARLHAVLGGKELQVITLIYGFEGDPMSFIEVAEMMHLTSARVHHLHDVALVKMEQVENSL